MGRADISWNGLGLCEAYGLSSVLSRGASTAEGVVRSTDGGSAPTPSLTRLFIFTVSRALPIHSAYRASYVPGLVGRLSICN